MARKSKLTPFHDLVGTVPDREIAVMAGCSIATVCHYRQRHHIPSFRSSRAPEALRTAQLPSTSLQPAAKPRNLRSDTPQGYAVTLKTDQGSREVYLIASGIVEAAERASAFGTVIKLSHIGPALLAT